METLRTLHAYIENAGHYADYETPPLESITIKKKSGEFIIRNWPGANSYKLGVEHFNSDVKLSVTIYETPDLSRMKNIILMLLGD